MITINQLTLDHHQTTTATNTTVITGTTITITLQHHHQYNDLDIDRDSVNHTTTSAFEREQHMTPYNINRILLFTNF